MRLAQSEVTKLALYCDADPQAPRSATPEDHAAIGAATFPRLATTPTRCRMIMLFGLLTMAAGLVIATIVWLVTLWQWQNAERDIGMSDIVVQLIVLPLQDMALSVTSALGYLGEAVVNDVDRPRYGNEIFGTFGRDFRTSDGRFVMICIFSDRHVDALAAAGGFAAAFKKIEAETGVDLKTDAGRWTARARLCAVIEPWVAAHTAADVGAALKKAGALWAPYQTFRELATDKDAVQDNPLFTVLDQPGIDLLRIADGKIVEVWLLSSNPEQEDAFWGK
mgnify:CR=1 FL=1